MFAHPDPANEYQKKYKAFCQIYIFDIDIDETENQLNTDTQKKILLQALRNMTTDLNIFMNELREKVPGTEILERVIKSQEKHKIAIQQLDHSFAGVENLVLVIDKLIIASNNLFERLNNFALVHSEAVPARGQAAGCRR